MALEVKNSPTIVCARCGQAYANRRNYYYKSTATLYKGITYFPYCKPCIDQMYEQYLIASGSPKLAVRQMCRKLDLYWNESVYENVAKSNADKNIMLAYNQRLNTLAYAGKCYDDTLKEDDSLWAFSSLASTEQSLVEAERKLEGNNVESVEISNEVKAFWGPGYTPEMYDELQGRYDYWLSKFPEGSTLDVGGEILLKQICNLEIDINRDRAAGKPIDKSVNALNTLLGSAMLKPVQKKSDEADSAAGNTPYGVWIRRFEDERPIPDVDPELKDVDRIIWYITVWFFGHLCKMLGIKNSYCKLYEEAIAKRRVERPDLDDEDDDTFIADEFADADSGGDDDDF